MSEPIDRRKFNGGQRPGAGRHPIGSAPRVNAQFQIDPDLLTRLRDYAQANGVSMSQVINDLLKNLFSC